jgi:hypothetical protein
MSNSKNQHYQGTFLAWFGKNVLSFWRKEMQSNSGVVSFDVKFFIPFFIFLSFFLSFFLDNHFVEKKFH